MDLKQPHLLQKGQPVMKDRQTLYTYLAADFCFEVFASVDVLCQLLFIGQLYGHERSWKLNLSLSYTKQ